MRVLETVECRGELCSVSKVDQQSSKRRRIDNTAPDSDANPVCKTAAMVTAKWSAVEYDVQMTRKRRKWLNALRTVTKKLRSEVYDVEKLPWLAYLVNDQMVTKRNYPACCMLADVIGAKEEEEMMFYRNKNEFTVGLSPSSCPLNHPHTAQITVGYMLGLVRDGVLTVGPVDEQCLTTSKTAISIAQCLTKTIRQLNMPHYDKTAHTGYWRQITVREGIRTGQVVVTVMVNSPSPSSRPTKENAYYVGRDDQRCRKQIVKSLCDHLGPIRDLGVFWQVSSEKSAQSSEVPPVHLYGIDALYEKLCGLTFRIQPTAFFQVNTLMAEKLYDLIGQLADVDKETVVLDLCCGTGTIGLSLAKRVHSVIGIELNASAVADAEFNAKLNNITNATFIAGKVEQHIQATVKKLSDRPCVVILDPPRAGVHSDVIAAIRSVKAVKRIVYVSCEPNNFWQNARALCRPTSKQYKLDPFKPIEAYGVDLFPHTDHAELVILLQRGGEQISSVQMNITKKDIDKIKKLSWANDKQPIANHGNEERLVSDALPDSDDEQA